MPKRCKFIDDEAELSDNDESGKKLIKKRKIESSEDEELDDVPNENDLAFIDDTVQMDHKSDASSVHSSENELCSGDELILREARGSRVRQVQDSLEEEYDDDVEDDEDDDSDDDECVQHQSSIQHYFHTSLKPENSIKVTDTLRARLDSKLMTPSLKTPEHLRNLKKTDVLKRDAVSFGHHVTEDEKPIKNVEQVKSTWDFLSGKPNSAQTKSKEGFRIPGMIRTPNGLFYESKNGKRIRVNETV